MSHVAYVGMGSNLNEPLQQINTAVDALRQHEALDVIAVSPLYRSKPIGQPGQDDYINGVLKLSTELSASELLSVLQAVENQQGRVRNGVRWGSRTLDLDILLFNQQQMSSERLTIPHPEMINRDFVLIPLRDIVGGELAIAGLGTLNDLCAKLPQPDTLERVQREA